MGLQVMRVSISTGLGSYIDNPLRCFFLNGDSVFIRLAATTFDRAVSIEGRSFGRKLGLILGRAARSGELFVWTMIDRLTWLTLWLEFCVMRDFGAG